MKPFITIVSPGYFNFINKLMRFIGQDGTYVATAFFPVVISEAPLNQNLIFHEGTHIIQQLMINLITSGFIFLLGFWNPWIFLALLWCWMPFIGPFYCLYLLFYLLNRLRGMNTIEAYYNIPFEIQATMAEIEGEFKWNLFEALGIT